MAKATMRIVAVTLELELEEVQALQAVLGLVGGEPRTTRRRYIDAIRGALNNPRIDESNTADITGSVWFKS